MARTPSLCIHVVRRIGRLLWLVVAIAAALVGGWITSGVTGFAAAPITAASIHSYYGHLRTVSAPHVISERGPSVCVITSTNDTTAERGPRGAIPRSGDNAYTPRARGVVRAHSGIDAAWLLESSPPTHDSVLATRAATESPVAAVLGLVPENNFNDAAPSDDASILFLDARTVVQVEVVGRHAPPVDLQGPSGAVSDGSVVVSGFVVAANAGAKLPWLILKDSQFGTKVGKHGGDFGLDPADPGARLFLRNRIADIHANPTEARKGPWNPKAGGVELKTKIVP